MNNIESALLPSFHSALLKYLRHCLSYSYTFCFLIITSSLFYNSLLLQTKFSLFLLFFLSVKSILLLTADAPTGEDFGVAEAKAEPGVARRGVPHVQGDGLIAVMQLEGRHQQGEVQVKVGPLGIVSQVLWVEVQDSLPSPT